MGSNQSSHADFTDVIVDMQQLSSKSCSVRGRKATTQEFGSDPTEATERLEEDFYAEEDEMTDVPLSVMEEDDDDDDESEDDDEEEEMYDEEAERKRIMDEVKQLKMIADMYLHPEKPIKVHATACARCFFDRPSAVALAEEEAEEHDRILQDAMTLKKLAVDFMHPEHPVETTDSSACARCFFDRASAPEQETVEDAEEAKNIMTELTMLKNIVVAFAHPESPVVTSDPCAFGRNYFDRPSALEPESLDDSEECAFILEDAVTLKKIANDFLHPELPVVTTDPTVFGRNYFERPSAYEQEDADEEEERRQVLAEAAALKKLAVDYLHPEAPVVTADPTLFGRNYFSRPSAPEQEVMEEADERKLVLADVMELKKLSMDYFHPEMPVSVDPTAFGRNYFSRPLAPEQDDDEDRSEVLADVAALKKLAVDYLHPEMPVVTTDAVAFGRNFFTRPSAPEQDDDEDRSEVLADVAALKKLATDYLHPEMPVITKDATAFGRNYFSRPSAPEQDDLEEERRQILADMAAFKKLAVDYHHPELPVTTDATAFGRNYFSRPSAPEQEDDEELVEVLADVAALKKLAVDYARPELPVVTTDPTVFGRNYFTRPSAPDQEFLDEQDERIIVMEELAALKKNAVDYMHPEVPVVTNDSTACGRNFFSRSSAPQYETDEDASETAQVLKDASMLKKLAVDYAHPELPVVTSDPCAFGRNFFIRPSAPEMEEDADESTQVLVDAALLKKLAAEFAHPELSVVTTDSTAFGRNFFTRPSAPAQEFLDDAEDRSFSMEESASLKKSAVDYTHPELPCVTTDFAATGRNYFDRPSAPGHSEYIHSSGYENREDKYDMHYCDDSYQEHSDHFDMDEDIWSDMYASLHLPHGESEMALKDSNTAPKKIIGATSLEEEEEGKLSRSPSSVMLFEQGNMEGY